MLIVTPSSSSSSSVRSETMWSDLSSQEHLLERISLLEVRLAQVTDRLSQALDLMMRQTKAVQKDRLSIETLIGKLSATGLLENDKAGQNWQEKNQFVAEHETFESRFEQTRAQILAGAINAAAPDSFKHLVNDGFRLLSLGDERQGLKTLERAAAAATAASNCANVFLITFIGEYYFRAGKYAVARGYLEQAHQIAPTDMRISLLLGFILSDANEFEKAKMLLKPFGQIDSFAANLILGLIYAAEKDLENTLIAFKRALSAAPSADAYYLVGSIYAELGRGKTALRHFHKAVEIDSNFADAWFMLGAVYLRLGKEKEAKSALNQSLSIQDLTAQSQAILRSPQKFNQIAGTSLICARINQVKKNLISGCPPRLIKLLREDIEKNETKK